jgi:Undecaprenyl-phosphate glucose phosphotransferase
LLGQGQSASLFQSEAQILMKTGPEKLKYVVAADRLPKTAAGLPVYPKAKSQFISSRVVSASACFADGLVVLITGLGVAAFYPGFGPLALPHFYIPLVMAVAFVLPILLQMSRNYSLPRLLHPLANISTILICWTSLIAITSSSIFIAKAADSYSRLWIGMWFLAGVAGLLAARFAFSTMVRRWNKNGQLSRHAVLVGGGEPAHQLYEALSQTTDNDVTLVGIFDDRGDDRLPVESNDLPKLGNITQLIEFVRQARVDVLFVTLPLVAEERLLQILKRLWVLPVDIRLCAQNQKLRYRPRAYSYVGNVPFLDVFDKPLGDWDTVLKSIEDKVIAFAALVVLAPVMALIALAIKLESKGPVFFKQKRYGFNNELIEVYKFRSMYNDKLDFHAEKLTTRDDPRVTRVGRLIRRTSTDELPQLFNVLIGNLSLVGPRPHATKAKAADQLYNDVVDGYFARHRVKPGITGWAQVNGWRGQTDTAEKLQRRVEHDLYYIENWSLALDLYILARTPFSLFDSENAF